VYSRFHAHRGHSLACTGTVPVAPPSVFLPVPTTCPVSVPAPPGVFLPVPTDCRLLRTVCGKEERTPSCGQTPTAVRGTSVPTQVVDLCVRTEHKSRGLSSCCGASYHGGVTAVSHGTSRNSAVDSHARDEAHAAACPRTDFAFVVCRAPRRIVLVWRLGTMFDPAAESQAAC